ncbi:MAG: hypothetical protein R3E84_24510, partial [Pseudomonadales bacterium]
MGNPVTGIGAAVVRREDARFITGAGRYTDDIRVEGQAYAVFVRSPYAHARIVEIDCAQASEIPGVVAILTGDDMQADGIGSLPCGWNVTQKDGTDMRVPPHPPLATGHVNYVGDPVAVVVAESLETARQAAEAVAVEFDELPPVVDLATAQVSAEIHAGITHNLAYEWELGDREA